MVSIDLKEMGARFAKARTVKNLSGRALGQMIDKSVGYMYQVENGNVNLSLSTFVELCNILELNPKDFFIQTEN